MGDAGQHKSGWIARALVFGALWFVASFFFFGDLGKFSDDWMFHVRDPVTDSFEWGKVFALMPLDTGLWRPFHIHLAILLNTVLWSHDAVIHGILAAFHGVNAWLVWKVLARLCVSRQAPAVGAILFLVYPAGHEAIFWLSTVGTSVGVCGFLVCVLAAMRFATGEIGWRGLLAHSPILLTLGWWYEQSAAIAPAIACAYLAVAPLSVPVRKRFGMAAGIAGAAFVGGALYAALLMGTILSSARGGAQSVNGAAELFPQTKMILRQAWEFLSLSGFAKGAFIEGWSAMRARPLESVGVLAVLMMGLPGLVKWWMRSRSDDQPDRVGASECGAKARSRRAWALLLGAGIVLASVVPAIAVRNQWFASRLVYHTVLGILVMVAVLADLWFASLRQREESARVRAARAGALAALMLGSIVCAIMLAGVQSVWHKRWESDLRVIRDIQAFAPDPPAHAVFLPTRVEALPTSTGSTVFDDIGMSVFEFHWSASLPLRFAYARNEVWCLGYNRWLPPGKRLVGVEGATEEHLLLKKGFWPRTVFSMDDAERKVVPWGNVMAFEIGAGGHARSVDSIRVETAENPARDRVVQLPATRRVPGQEMAAPGLLVALPSTDTPPMRLAWRLMDANGSEPRDQVEATDQRAMDQACVAFTMHPRIPEISDRHVLKAQVPASERARVVAMRVAIPDHALGASDGVEVAVYVDGEAEPIAREVVTPERLKRERKWIVVRGEVRPLGVAQRIRVVVTSGAAGNPNSDWCLVGVPVVVDK